MSHVRPYDLHAPGQAAFGFRSKLMLGRRYLVYSIIVAHLEDPSQPSPTYVRARTCCKTFDVFHIYMITSVLLIYFFDKYFQNIAIT